MQSTVLDRLTDVLREVFDNDAIVATPQLRASMVDGWDSLANVRLFLEVERAFCVRFSASEISSLQNVGELADLINTKLRRSSS